MSAVLDGNGRTGRLWHTLLLSRWRPVLTWIPIESIILAHQQEYHAAMAQSDAAGDSAAFVELMLKMIKEAIEPYCAAPLAVASRSRRTMELLAEDPTMTLRTWRSTAANRRFGFRARTSARRIRC